MRTASIAALFLLVPGAWAAAPGDTGFTFLTLGASARETSMAETGVALRDDLSGAFLNPAGAGGPSSQQVSFAYEKIFDDLSYGQAGYLHPTEGHGTFAGKLDYLNYGAIAGADATGLQTGNVSASDRMLTMSWASRRQDITPGVSLKVVQESLADVTATAFAVDLGAVYSPRQSADSGSFWSRQLSLMSFGAAIRNAGPPAHFDQQAEQLPLSAVVGAAHRSFKGSLIVALDIERAQDKNRPIVAHLGAETWIKDVLALRVGLRSDQDIGLPLTWGVGIKAGAMQVDYAMQLFGALGFTHRIGLTMRFGAGLAESSYEKGLHAMREGNYADAVLFFDKALAVDPRNRKVLRAAMDAARALEKELPPSPPSKDGARAP